MHTVLGIDVGKSELFIAFAPPHAKTPSDKIPTIRLQLKNPRWWRELLDLISPDAPAIVVAEPTGANLLAPIANVLDKYRPNAALFEADHKLAANYRERHLSEAKNDRLDAIALYLAAQDIASGNPPRGVYLHDNVRFSAVQLLRLHVNIHERLSKELTRTKNRLNVIAHGLAPAFALSMKTWLNAVEAGYISPAQIRELAAMNPPHDNYRDGRARRFLINLAADLPDIETNAATRRAIRDLLDQQRSAETQIDENLEAIRELVLAPPFETVTRRWLHLPGASLNRIAAVHVASAGDVLNFEYDQFVGALGAHPKTSISGSKDKTRKTRRGYRPARRALHLWTLTLLNHRTNQVAAYFYGREGRTLAHAKTKLARVLWGMARDERLDHQPLPNQSESEE